MFTPSAMLSFIWLSNVLPLSIKAGALNFHEHLCFGSYLSITYWELSLQCLCQIFPVKNQSSWKICLLVKQTSKSNFLLRFRSIKDMILFLQSSLSILPQSLISAWNHSLLRQYPIQTPAFKALRISSWDCLNRQIKVKFPFNWSVLSV